jgi:hypothetical protein
MRRYAFILTILGLFTLFLLLFVLPPKTIQNPEDFQFLEENQKVQVHGKVVKETLRTNEKILILDNEIELICDRSCPSYLNKEISAIGLLEKFNKPQIIVLRISIK